MNGCIPDTTIHNLISQIQGVRLKNDNVGLCIGIGLTNHDISHGDTSLTMIKTIRFLEILKLLVSLHYKLVFAPMISKVEFLW